MKIKEIRDLSPNELQQKAGELSEELFRLQLRRTSGQLDSSAVLGHVLYREGILNNTCAGNYGECVYKPVCSAPNRETGQRILEANYKLKPYTPLSFRKGIQKI